MKVFEKKLGKHLAKGDIVHQIIKLSVAKASESIFWKGFNPMLWLLKIVIASRGFVLVPTI